MPKSPNPCADCQAAIELDQIAIVAMPSAGIDPNYVDGRRNHPAAELGVICCDPHLRRLVLALELLAAFETAMRAEVPGLAEIVYQDAIVVEPERRPA